MKMSPFEAVSFYDFINRNRNGEVIPSLFYIVVFNVDDYSIGFCTCTKEGQVKTIDSRALSVKSSCMDDIHMIFCDTTKSKDSICDCVNSCLDGFNNKMWTYYQSERRMNPDFKDTLGIDLDCAGFDSVFNVARSRLGELLLELDDLWSKTKFNEDESRFIIVGKAALYYPIEHYIKEFLTFDPFLPDDRFVSDTYPDKADEIIDIGTREYSKKKESERNIYIKIVKGNNSDEKKKIPVLDTHEDGAKIEYLEPIFISADDQLEFELNLKKLHIDIPYSIAPLDYDIIGVGASISDNKLIIRLRRYNHPTRIYDILVV